jgi:hypothetical protein
MAQNTKICGSNDKAERRNIKFHPKSKNNTPDKLINYLPEQNSFIFKKSKFKSLTETSIEPIANSLYTEC